MTQAKTLRVLEDRKLERLGGEQVVSSDFRLIAATNRDLAAAVEEGDFREDLYYRLNIIRIELPALRSRLEDLPELVDEFLQQLSANGGLPRRTVSPAGIGALLAHDWPGNVRELRNVIERLVVLGDSDVIGGREVRESLRVPSAPVPPDAPADLRGARDEFERVYIRRVLATHSGRVQETAEALGINRSHLWKKIKRLGIDAA
jgi:two-component system nitrogen regulation response regulator NtrX